MKSNSKSEANPSRVASAALAGIFRPAGGLCGRAFTLIELLVVIAIIGILAAMLLPTIARVKVRAQVSQAQQEISHIVRAIHAYNSTYSRYPVSSNVMAAAANSIDMTFGGLCKRKDGSTFMIPQIGGIRPTNNEVIAILMDMETYPNGTPTINDKHVKNPQQHKFLQEVKMAADINSPGIGPDGVYRDPWGNPYIISMDLNYDEKCYDVMYGTDRLSQGDPNNNRQGLNGLAGRFQGRWLYEANSSVMVWSLGPDRNADPGVKANISPNKDNILSWKQ